jgi:regulator of protease activity HflC (stomatin/prohibitin superfamily)
MEPLGSVFCIIALASIVGVILAIILIASKPIIIVRQAEAVVVERLGKYNRVLQSGPHIVLPFIESLRRVHWRKVAPDGIQYIRHNDRIPLREAVYDFPPQNVITKDNVAIGINGLLYFQVTDPLRAVYEIENLPLAIEKLTQTTLRNICGEMELDETLVSRDVINTKLKNVLDEATDKWGVKVNRVELQDISPPAEVRDAMEKQMRAERDRRAVILEAEGAKQNAILRAEGERESKIKRAEGERESVILEADGQAEARRKMAEAERVAIKLVADALTGVDDPSKYLVAVRYIEALKHITEGESNKLIIVPYEANALISGVAGIKKIWDELES